MKSFLAILAFVVMVSARPEPPRGRIVNPQKQIALYPTGEQSDEYGPPAPASYPATEYGAPTQEYGPPVQEYAPAVVQEYGPPTQEYGPPALEYGPPAQKIITKNVYVHIPPEEPEQIVKSAPIEVPVAKKHYKIIFIKAPAPPVPTTPTIPIIPQDEHKTLVYVLVKKPEEQKPIEIPVAEPTEPSKPEVYFIKYKHNDKEPATAYGPPTAQSAGYPATAPARFNNFQ